MTTYVFRSDDAAVEIPLSRAEGILYVWVRESPDWEVPVFGVPMKGMVRRRSRDELVEKTDRLVALLEAEAHLLGFTYSLERPWVNGQSCSYRGRQATLECGAGYCQIVESEIRPSPKHPGASVVVSHRLADLRDMHPVTLDDGREVKAKRRPGKHDLLGKVRELKAFLSKTSAPWIECSVR